MCGGRHYAANCPQQKGGGKGWYDKGKGKGKGLNAVDVNDEQSNGEWYQGGDGWSTPGSVKRLATLQAVPQKKNVGYFDALAEKDEEENEDAEDQQAQQLASPAIETHPPPPAPVGASTQTRSIGMEALLGTARAKERQGERKRRHKALATGWSMAHESRGCDCGAEKCVEEKASDKDPAKELERRVRGHPSTSVPSISALSTVEPGNLKAINHGWQELEFTVDSGASETVMSEEELPTVQTKEGAAYKRGVEYEVANGTRISNEGEKTFNAYTAGGAIRTITAQICDVNKPLLSVRKLLNQEIEWCSSRTGPSSRTARPKKG